MNWALIFANAAAFVAGRCWPQLLSSFCLNPRDPAMITCISYTFVHASVTHLLGNLLFLYIFGNNVNDRMGSVGYLAFYLAGGAFAGVTYTLTDLHSVIGASGAVAAVMGAYLVLFPRSHVIVSYAVGAMEIPGMWFVGFFLALDLILNIAAADTGIAHIAHLSGTLFGFGVCYAMLSVNLLQRDTFDVVALIGRWNRRRVYRDVVAAGYDPFAYTPRRDRAQDRLAAPVDPKARQIQDLRAEIAESLAHHNHPHAALLFLELKQLDPRQVLSRQAQLEVANQLAGQQLYAEAAEAYEAFIAHYRNFEQLEQVELMLGLICVRYLRRYVQGREYLLRALARLHTEREIALARSELQRAEALLADPRTQR